MRINDIEDGPVLKVINLSLYRMVSLILRSNIKFVKKYVYYVHNTHTYICVYVLCVTKCIILIKQ